MKQPSALALKHASVEEWADVHFFRPVGIRVARALEPTRATADQVTLGALLVGLLAGHLLVYRSLALNLAGVALFVVSDVLDSADGQLARLRGTSTRLGRALDGIADTVRFLNLYVHLFVRLVHAEGWGWPGLLLAGAAIWSHSLQGATVDFIKNVFLEVGAGARGEADLPEDLAPARRGGTLRATADRLYGAYTRRQAMMFPVTVRLVRAARNGGAAPASGLMETYARLQAPLLPVLTLIATNVRFVVLLVAVLAGHVSWFLFVTAVPMNLVMIAAILVHERNAAGLLQRLAAPVRVPAVAD